MLSIALITLAGVASRLFEGRWLSAPSVLAASLLGPLVLFDIHIAWITKLVLYAAAICFAAAYYSAVAISLIGSSGTACRTSSNEEIAALTRAAWALFALGQLAFTVNLYRVISNLGLLAYVQSSSKDIELTFGASTLLNYVFFLNLPAACIATYIIAIRSGSWPLRALLSWAIVSLAFTGIKSTMIFGACMVFFIYLYVRRPSVIWVAAASAGFACAVIALFIAVNIEPGALAAVAENFELISQAVDIARGYVVYNYLNLDLEIALRDVYTYGKYTFFFISKLLDPKLVGYFDTQDFIVLDENYNMGTFIREYFVDFGALGALGIPALIGFVSGLTANAWRRHQFPRHATVLAVLLTASAFAFFGNQFVRLQFWYVIAVAYIVDLVVSVDLQSRADSVGTKVGAGNEACAA